MRGTRWTARVAVVCTLTCAASATPAYAQDGGGLANLVGRAVQQVAGALPQIPLPQPAQPAPAPAVPAEPVPSAPAPAAPGPAGPQAPEPAAGGPVGPSQEARPAPSSPKSSPSTPARRANPEVGGRTSNRADATSGGGNGRANVSASAASASDAGDGARAMGAQRRDPAAVAAQAGDPGAIATANPVATGAQATEDSSGALPFTGSGVPLLAAIGLLGLAAGLLLRRITRAGA